MAWRSRTSLSSVVNVVTSAAVSDSVEELSMLSSSAPGTWVLNHPVRAADRSAMTCCRIARTGPAVARSPSSSASVRLNPTGRLAGVLVVFGAGIGFGAWAALAALAAMVLGVGLRGNFPPQPSGGSSGTALAQVREGLAFLVRHPVMRPPVISSSVLNLASTAYFAVFVLWAVGPSSAMRLSPSQYPLVMLGFALGAVAGSVLAEHVQLRLGVMPTILTTLVASVLLLLVPMFWPNAWAVAVAVTLVGVTNTVGNVVSQSLRQRLVPGVLLGRVSGAARTLAFGLIPLGALLGGLVAERAGLPATFLAAIALSLATCGYLAVAVRPADVRAAEAGVVRP